MTRCTVPDVTSADFAVPTAATEHPHPGDGRVERFVTVADLTVTLRDHRWRDEISAVFREADHVLVDLAVTPRPALVQGWLERPGGVRRWSALGELFVVPPGVAFDGYAPGGASRLYRHRSLSCVLPRRLFDVVPDADLLWQEALFERCLDLRSPTTMQSLRRMLQELLEPGAATGAVLQGLAAVVAVDVARALQFELRRAAPRGGLPAWRLRALAQRLQDEALPPPTVAELAHAVSLSQRQLMRAFRQHHGESLGQHVRRICIERSKRLLAAHQLTVKQIAVLVGFASTASFSHAFHQATGLRPSDYQRMCRQGAGTVGEGGVGFPLGPHGVDK